MQADPAALRLAQVGVRYPGRDTPAVTGVSFEVAAGGVTAIMGPSGAGKSSLLGAVNRLHDLVEGIRVEGRVEVGGMDVAAFDPNELRRQVGTILQRPLPFAGSIAHNVSFALRCHGVPRSEIADRVEEALTDAALWPEVRDRLSSEASALSGGQQQRLCLARALALRPRAVLLDEPCASLDPAATAKVEESLRKIAGQTTILLVTHNLAQARRLAQRVVALWPGVQGGRCVAEGPTAAIFADPPTPELRAWVSGAIG